MASKSLDCWGGQGGMKPTSLLLQPPTASLCPASSPFHTPTAQVTLVPLFLLQQGWALRSWFSGTMWGANQVPTPDSGEGD